MNHCRRNPLTICLAVVILVGLFLSNDVANCAVPIARVLPAITEGIAAPVKIAADASTDNYYVADPVAGGILKYNRSGTLIDRYVTPKNVTGLAIALNGNLLVTQGTYIDVINVGTRTSIPGKQFGTFGNATDITIDNLGNAYVTDGMNNNVTKFTYAGISTDNYGTNYAGGTATIIITGLKNPTAIAFEKTSPGFLYVANALGAANNTIQIYSTAGVLAKGFGSFGYVVRPITNGTTLPKFTYPQSITFEYDATNKLNRVYVADAYQGFVQVLDGTYTYAAPAITGNFYYIADISSYGFNNGHLFVPSAVLFDQKDINNRRLLVANGAGSLAVFSIDAAMFPSNFQLASRDLNSLALTWEKPTDPNFISVEISRSTDNLSFSSLVVSTGTSYVDTGLTAGTKYYYRIRALDSTPTPNEYPNSLLVTGTTLYNYSLTLTAQSTDALASGQINGTTCSATGTCTSTCSATGTCTSTIAEGSTVTLLASPNALTSVFNGWSGTCSAFNIDSTKCEFTMSGNTSATASFVSQNPYSVAGQTFKTLQDAYAYAYTYDIPEIRVLSGIWPAGDYGPMFAWYAPNTVKIKGGYDSEFVAQISTKSVITGGMRLNAGKVMLERVFLRP